MESVYFDTLVYVFVGLSILLCFFVVNRRSDYMRPIFLFFLSYFIVHFQFPLEYVLGNDPQKYIDFDLWINKNIVFDVVLISGIGICALFLGYYLAGLFLIKSNVQRFFDGVVIHRDVFWSNVFIVLTYCFFALFLYGVGDILLFHMYVGSGKWDGNANYYYFLFCGFLYHIVISKGIYIYYKYDGESISLYRFIREMGYPINIIVGAYLLLFLLLGSRGAVLSGSFVYLIPYFIINSKKINGYKFVLFFIVAGFALTFIGIARRSLDQGILYAFSNASWEDRDTFIFPWTAELAGSVRCVNYAVQYVPSKYPFFSGLFQFNNILSAIPFSSHILSAFYEPSSISFLSSPSFITFLEAGRNPSSGTGTSCVADLYLDFGITGVFLGMLLFGFLIKKIEYIYYRETFFSLFFYVVSIIYMSNMIYLARAPLLSSVKIIVLVFLLSKINTKVVSVHLNK